MEGSHGRRLSQSSANLQEQPPLPVAHRPQRYEPAGGRIARPQGLSGGAGAECGFAGRSGSDGPLHIAKHRQLPVRVLRVGSGGYPRGSLSVASVHVSTGAGVAVLPQVQIDNEFGHREA